MIDQPNPADLPQHLCQDCLVKGTWLRIPLDDGGSVIGTFCDHHQCGCALQVDDEDKPSPWLTVGPINTFDFRVWLQRLANSGKVAH